MGALSQGSSDGTLGNAGGVNTKEPYINGGSGSEPLAEARWCVTWRRGWQAERRTSCPEPPGGTSAAQHPGFPRLKAGTHFPCAVALSLRWFVAAATGSWGGRVGELRQLRRVSADAPGDCGPPEDAHGRPWSPGFPEHLGPCVPPTSHPVASEGEGVSFSCGQTGRIATASPLTVHVLNVSCWLGGSFWLGQGWLRENSPLLVGWTESYCMFNHSSKWREQGMYLSSLIS